MRHAALAALALLAACDSAVPEAPSTNSNAIAAAERQATGDTDAAIAEARAKPTPATIQADAGSSR